MIPLCLDQGVAITPYSPLARGRLARGRHASAESRSVRSGTDPAADQMTLDGDNELIDALSDVAAARELPPAQPALAWLLARPGVVAPIIGATKNHHIDDAVAALDITLTDTETTTRGRVPPSPAPRTLTAVPTYPNRQTHRRSRVGASLRPSRVRCHAQRGSGIGAAAG